MNTLQTYFETYHRPVWAEIDLACIAHNVREFRAIIPPQTEIIAIVKADAYGHGAYHVANAALEAGASRFAVALLEEGIALRRKGLTAPIQLLGISAPGTEAGVVSYQLCPTICTLDSAARFADVASARGQRVRFHLKLDTGMGRIGVRPPDLPALLDGLQRLPQLEMEGVFSHFAKADETDQTYTKQQLQRFHECLALIRQAGFAPQVCHIANSAGSMEIAASHCDLVRIGISLYGLYPSSEVHRDRVHLRPALTWKTRIAHLKTLPPGERVSYGGLFTTTRPTVVATLPVGYADGYRRILWQRGGSVLVHGQRAPIIGKICMDMCMADVTAISGVQTGDEVVLIGMQGAATISADDMAAQLETINYEITCLIGKRVPRVYLKEGTIIAVESLLGEQTAAEVWRVNA